MYSILNKDIITMQYKNIIQYHFDSKYKKTELLRFFNTYSEAAEFFSITRGAISQWKYIPKLRLYELEKAGYINFKD